MNRFRQPYPGHWRNPLLSALLYALMYFFPLVVPNALFLLPLLHQVEKEGNGSAVVRLRLGFLFGCTGSLLILHWMYTMAEISWTAFPLYLAMSAGFGAILALAIALAGWLRARTGWSWALLLPACWLPLEWARTFGDLRMNADHLGHTLGPTPFLGQFLDLTGLYGGGAAILVVNGLLFDLWNAGRSRSWKRPAAALALLLVSVLGYDLWAWNHYGEAEKTIRVGVVQPNISLETKWNSRFTARAQWKILREGTEKAVEEGAELVVWPETAYPQEIDHLVTIPETWEAPALQNLALRLRTPLLAGAEYRRFESKSRSELYNAAVAVHGDGMLDPVWTAKTYLVPFTEKTPFEPWLLPLIDRFGSPTGESHWMRGGFTPGPRGTVLPMEAGNAGVIVCYEELFPDLSRALRNAGSDFQAVITNDAWFGRSLFQRFLVNALRLRAIENRTGYVRAANTGVSGFFDRRGAASRLTPLFQEAVIVGEVPLSERPTFYDRVGDWPVGAALFLLVLGMGKAIRGRHRGDADPPPASSPGGRPPAYLPTDGGLEPLGRAGEGRSREEEVREDQDDL